MPLWTGHRSCDDRAAGAPDDRPAARRAWPYYANWIGSSAVISIHNNGGGGGTETWYDTSNGYASQSYALAALVQARIIERVCAVEQELKDMEAATEMLESLTFRERDVLKALAEGYRDKEIAALLRIANGTVRLHVHRVLGKLGVENRVQAVLKAQRLGLLK